MTPASQLVSFDADADGVGWIVFDNPRSRACVLNPPVFAALRIALRDAASRAGGLKAVVVSGAKEGVFIAGADIAWLSGLDEAAALAASREGHAVFQEIADSPVPFVCAIRGGCAGGGFELALACHWRLAADDAATRIGLPETSLGAIPGWGGCVRLPRLIGAAAALEHMMKARLVPAAEALKAGLVDEVVPSAGLRARAKETALRLAGVRGEGGAPARPPAPVPAPEWFAAFRRATLLRTQGREPAAPAAIDAVERGATAPLAQALEIEAAVFAHVVGGEVAKNRMRGFFLQEAARKRTLDGWFPPRPPGGAAPAPIGRVGVVGAGVMGSGIAHWLASRGFEVVLRDLKPEWLERGMAAARGLFDDSVRRGFLAPEEAAAGLARIGGTTGWDGFERCDLVIEAVVEDASAKRSLFSEIAAVARADALLASNTSALPIEEIAGHVPHPDRTLGIHFFNPVSRMPLVELVLGRTTSAEAAERALLLLKRLGKLPVVCKSSPGFLVTRVLFFYLNEAVRLWEEGASAAEIDAAMRAFGWPMGPLRLIDEVGIDVTEAIFGEMARYFPARFRATAACGRLLEAGFKGRKGGAGSGFYLHKMGRGGAEEPNPKADAGRPRPAADAPPRFAEGIASHLMEAMTAEAGRCIAEGVVRSPNDVDFALLSGAGFPAFRGGLMRCAEARNRSSGA